MPYNPNTKVLEIRTGAWPVVDLDVDFDFDGDGRKEKKEALEKLGVWAKRQVESWSGGRDIKDKIFNGQNGLNNRHPVDCIPYWITMEPILMLSNLPIEQLAKIEHLLDVCCLSCDTYPESESKLREAQLVVGAFRLGREAEKAQSITQFSGS